MRYFCCIVLAFVSIVSCADEQDVARDVSIPISAVQWHPREHKVSYLKAMSMGAPRSLVVFDVDTQREKVLFSQSDMQAGVKLSLSHYRWSPDGTALLIPEERELWLLTFPKKELRELAHGYAEKEHATFSPDGHKLAFVSKNNLYVLDLASDAITQITKDGSETILNGTLDWVYEEELRHGNPSGRAFAWSPDSQKLSFLRLDQARVPEYPITEFGGVHPGLRKQHYPKSGDQNAIPTVVAVDLSDASLKRKEYSLPPLREYVLPELVWLPDSQSVAVTTLNRPQNELVVNAWNPWSGEARMLVHETDSAFVNVQGGPAFLPGGSEFVWLSERDGWLHAYLYKNDGTLLRQLTTGAWMIEPGRSHSLGGMPVEIDAKRRELYFTATERDPRERHTYRVSLEGEKPVEHPRRLTDDEGFNYSALSPDGDLLLQYTTSLRHHSAFRIARAYGTFVATLYETPETQPNPLVSFHEVTAKDGTILYGRLTKPEGFDPGKKYPVVVHIYGGPQFQFVVKTPQGAGFGDERLLQQGCLIWSLDNRGSWGRGHNFEKAVYKYLGKQELADQLDGLDYLKTLPFVDGSRVGIYGWSYGGYMTLYALTHAPDTFKCGLAGAPVTDWKFYDTIYTERYMRVPAENPRGYIESSPLAAAEQLKAKLMIVHGTSDDNVHMQNTIEFIRALTLKGRRYQLELHPGDGHGLRSREGWNYLTDRMGEFFKDGLSL